MFKAFEIIGFEYDIYYVDNYSFKLDVTILFQTVVVVLKHDDIGQGEERPTAFNIERQKEWDKAGKKSNHVI